MDGINFEPHKLSSLSLIQTTPKYSKLSLTSMNFPFSFKVHCCCHAFSVQCQPSTVAMLSMYYSPTVPPVSTCSDPHDRL